MKVHEAISRFLVAEDVDTVYSLISDETLGLLSSLRAEWAETIDVIEARHEQAAVAMADGYSRTTGEIGVTTVGREPAIAQTGTALTTAKAGSNVLVIVAATPRTSLQDPLNKEFNQVPFLHSLLDNVLTVPHEDVLVGRFAEAFRLLHSDAGSVAIELPMDVMDADPDIDETWTESQIGSSRVTTGETRLTPAPEKVDRTIDLYLDSDASVPPVILVGEGAVRSDAKDAIESLVERTNALLVTTLQAKGYFADHPYSVGFCGGFGTNLANT